MSFPILDDHMHLDPGGRGGEAVKDFLNAGGTALLLVHKPYSYPGPAADPHEWYADQFGTTLKLADMARDQGAKVWTALGAYPVDLVRLVEGGMPVEEARDFLWTGIEMAGNLITEGKAVCFGEVGRPHFQTSEEVVQACDGLLKDIMHYAASLNCAVVVHCESVEDKPDIWAHLANMADRAGLNRSRVVKHFSPPVVNTDENMGIFPSVLSSRTALRTALAQGRRFMMETDYIDDPKRPGAVMGIRTVPKRTKAFIQNGDMTEEDAWIIHHDNPLKVYGIDTSL